MMTVLFTCFSREPRFLCSFLAVLFGGLWAFQNPPCGRKGFAPALFRMFQDSSDSSGKKDWRSPVTLFHSGGGGLLREKIQQKKAERDKREKEAAERKKHQVRDHTGGYQRSPIINKVLLPYRGSTEDSEQR